MYGKKKQNALNSHSNFHCSGHVIVRFADRVYFQSGYMFYGYLVGDQSILCVFGNVLMLVIAKMVVVIKKMLCIHLALKKKCTTPAHNHHRRRCNCCRCIFIEWTSPTCTARHHIHHSANHG